MRVRRTLAIVAIAFSVSAAPVMGQEMDTLVLVPDGPSGGAVVAGCYRADRDLYGPFRLTMCLRRNGTYMVRGGGIRCDGQLTWRASGRDITINLQRTSCNRGQAWARARVECRGSGWIRGILDQIFGRNQRVLVPDTPAIRRLSCTYFPTVRGERNERFNASRV